MQAVPSEFLGIDRKARANKPFFDLDLRPPEERTCDFDDVIIEFNAERAMVEAARCIHCPDPAPCMVACPTSNDIPSAMWLIEQGRFTDAANLYHQTSSLPEICGRVCPHEALCQGSCVLNKHHTPVQCGELEVFAVDYKRRNEGHIHASGYAHWKESCHHRRRTRRSGLCRPTCSERTRSDHLSNPSLRRADCSSTAFPTSNSPRMSGMEKWEEFERAGVKFVPNTYIGKDKTIDGLFDEGFDAVFIGVGSEIDAKMEDTPGTDLPGVYRSHRFPDPRQRGT